MKASPIVVAAFALLFVAAQPSSSSWRMLESSLRELATARQRLVDERTKRVAGATAVAEDIERLSGGSAAPARAAAPLERRLQEFDRLAGDLDDLDRGIRDVDRRIARQRAAFAAAADVASARLARTAQGNTELLNIEAARQRVEGLFERPDEFRPLLTISFTGAETLKDLDEKLAVLSAERARGDGAVRDLVGELSVLSAREALKRRLLADVDQAVKTGPTDLQLLRGQAADLALSLQTLEQRRALLVRQRAQLVASLDETVRQLAEGETRKRALLARLPAQGGR